MTALALKVVARYEDRKLRRMAEILASNLAAIEGNLERSKYLPDEEVRAAARAHAHASLFLEGWQDELIPDAPPPPIHTQAPQGGGHAVRKHLVALSAAIKEASRLGAQGLARKAQAAIKDALGALTERRRFQPVSP